MASYKELTVWQTAMDLVTEIYNIAKLLPKEETYGLSSQMRRAAVSVPSNIAEGQARDTAKDFVRFLYIAQGSRAELQTQLEICVRLHYATEDQVATTVILCDRVGQMLRSLIRKLSTTSD